jgi:carboxypeptidase Q
MIIRVFCVLLFFSSFATAQNLDSIQIKRIFTHCLTNSKCYNWLDYLSNQIGGRLSGSPEATKAVNFVETELKQLDLSRVFLQDVMVPHWVRGEKENAFMSTKRINVGLNICALGGSIATPPAGITASVIEVHDFDELKALGKEKVKGKIVFMNHPMIPENVNAFTSYGEASKYRWGTASKAAALGAIGVVVRSMTLSLDDYPHTGAMGYEDSIVKIPACAISTIGANSLSNAIKNNPDLQFTFKQSCQNFEDAPSHNVIGEIKGSEFPDEIIVVGGHLDAWDLGDGSHDDGAGVVQSMEVLNTLKALNIQPRRTIRCVAFMNEENGGKGGEKHAELAKESKEKIIAALESDAGGFTPRGFSFNGDSLMMKFVTDKKELFYPYGLYEWKKGYGGADINHLKDQGTLLIGFSPDSQRYFEVHHAATDTFDRVNKRELELGAASMASLVWMLAEYGVGLKK